MNQDNLTLTFEQAFSEEEKQSLSGRIRELEEELDQLRGSELNVNCNHKVCLDVETMVLCLPAVQSDYENLKGAFENLKGAYEQLKVSVAPNPSSVLMFSLGQSHRVPREGNHRAT